VSLNRNGKRNTFFLDVFIIDLSPLLLRGQAAADPFHDGATVEY
jgi:hypothetical protein